MKLIKPDISQIEELKYYFNGNSFCRCAYALGSFILWADAYNARYIIINNMLIPIAEEEGLPSSFALPISDKRISSGRLDDESYVNSFKPVFDYMADWFKEIGRPLKMHCVSSEVYKIIDSWYPGKYTYKYSRNSSDYIYSVEKLSSLSGKKLHGKRNHINNFLKNHPDYVYETISSNNIDDCIDVAQKWLSTHQGEDEKINAEHKYEFNIICTALNNMDILGMIGGLIKINGEPIAFTLGEPLTEDTFDVHFEKADDSIQGAYPMINREFVRNELQDFLYVNREEDLGLPGLRKAKLSYDPDIITDTGIIIANE